jgi:hypothetical protein
MYKVVYVTNLLILLLRYASLLLCYVISTNRHSLMSVCDLGFALKFVLAGSMNVKLRQHSISCYLSGFFGEFFLQVTIHHIMHRCARAVQCSTAINASVIVLHYYD